MNHSNHYRLYQDASPCTTLTLHDHYPEGQGHQRPACLALTVEDWSPSAGEGGPKAPFLCYSHCRCANAIALALCGCSPSMIRAVRVSMFRAGK